MSDGYVLKSSVLNAIHSGDIDMGMVTTHEYRLLKDLSERIDRRIQRVPAADVQPVRHGRWKFKEDKAWVGNGKYWCSVCRYGFASGAYHEVDEFKFCPMCGSKMDGGEK